MSDRVFAYPQLIDDDGEVWPAYSPELRRRLVASQRPERFADYAVFNLGFVEVRAKHHGFAVTMRPDLVNDRTFNGLFYWMKDRRESPISFSWYRGAWHHQILTGQRQLMDLLSYLLAARKDWKAPAFQERVIVKPRALERSPFFGQVEKCRQILVSGRPSAAGETTLNAMFRHRWSLVVLDTETGQLTLRHHARGYPPLDPVWTSRPRPSFSELHDPDYAQSVIAAYRAAVRRKPAQIDDVDAIVVWPRFGETRARYTRMILPVGNEPGSVVFLSAACNAFDVDLRRDRTQISA